MEKSKSIDAIQIGGSLIGPDMPTFIIAEIGINHNGDVNLAKNLIDVAAKAKVNAVKFQKRHLPSLYKDDVLKYTNKYEQNFQYMIPVLKEVELSENNYFELKEYSIERGLEFLCTPFDIPSVNFLDKLNINAFKVASADLTNLELIDYIADRNKPMIISTGMSYWDEIRKTVSLVKEKNVPFILLHCRSAYPVWPREVNLRRITKLSQFGCPIGYSGHDMGIIIPLIAASMGASIIEKHITMDAKMPGPDHKISLEPHELERMVRDIRVADQAIGKEERFLLRGEIMNRELFGKSLIATTDIQTGTLITREMIRVQGPGKGLTPSRMFDLIGRKIERAIKKNEFFLEEDLNGNGLPDFHNSFRTRWGLISRFSDVTDMAQYRPNLIEFHLAEKDLYIDFKPNGYHKQELVVHVPEYMGEELFDLCSENELIRSKSVQLLQKTIELTQSIALHFKGKPKIVAHPGAMSLNIKLDKKALRQTLIKSITQIDTREVDLLLENLPPYPWYFGGQWKGNYFIDADEIVTFCEEMETKICFDLSHAALYCNAKGKNLTDYIQKLLPYISHIHFADAYGLDGEGVQIGEGDIDFDNIIPLFDEYQGTWVPEIWRGHLNKGKGFIKALSKLSGYNL